MNFNYNCSLMKFDVKDWEKCISKMFRYIAKNVLNFETIFLENIYFEIMIIF